MLGSASFLLSARKLMKELSHLRLNALHSSANLQNKLDKREGLLEQLYNDTDSARILDFLNTKSVEELERRNLGSERFQHLIVSQRPFKSLAEVLRLPRIDIVQVEKLCDLVLNKQEKTSAAPKRSAPCYPMISHEQALTVKTVTSLRLHSEQSSWVTMNDDLEFIQAGTHNMLPNGGKINLLKYDHIQYLDAMQSLAEQLPPSDAYLLFRQHVRLAGKTNVAIGLQCGRNLLDATFSTMITTRTGQNNIYVMTYPFIASLFHINIGNEMVNAESTVDKLIETASWKDHKLTSLDTLQRQRLSLKNKSISNHDPFSIPLLQCVGFITKILYPARISSSSSASPREGEDNHS